MQTVIMGYCVSSQCASISPWYLLCLVHMQPPQMFTTQRKTTDAFHVCGCNGPSVLLPLHVVMMNNICWETWNAPITEIPVSSLSDSGSSPSAPHRQWQPQLAGRITYTLHVSWFGIFSAGTQSTCLKVRFMVLFCLHFCYFREFYHCSLVKGLFWQLRGRGKWEIRTFSEKPAARDNMLL